MRVCNISEQYSKIKDAIIHSFINIKFNNFNARIKIHQQSIIVIPLYYRKLACYHLSTDIRQLSVQYTKTHHTIN